MLCLEQTRKRAENFQEFMDFLREHYRTGHMALLLDENPSHRDEQSQSLAEDLDIQLLWLPKRSPHLNPMDQLWGHGKSTVCANHQPATVEEQVSRFLDYYDALTATERLRYAGLLSPTYWLHQVRHL
jgi:transposase